MIALKDDLSNAIIANCKSWKGVYTTPAAATASTTRQTDL
tara:strand:- start:530 stop:649 length:120 start_codon:yes stop_codon:yes gene_type:complete